ncbi:MAG: sensor histidine kinase [Lachnospiraceae bacterium]
MFVIYLLVFICLVAIALYFSKLCVRPLEELAKKLERVSEGNLDTNLDTKSYQEVNQIVEAFNGLLEQLRKVEKSRQEFVSNVSHELKTPITSIRVLADSIMLVEDAPVEMYREFLGDISDEIDREAKIIEDLLSMVRMDKAGTKLDINKVDLNNLVEGVLKRVRPIAKRRDIELVFESNRQVTAEVDETKLSLAVTNLVENAVKYNNVGGWVHVSLDADYKYCYIKVEDNGIGVPNDAKDHLFERFYRVDKARSRETGGTGLGLAITKEIVLLHHGAIRLDSALGEGSTFTMRLPLRYIA